jgi:small conductance mechanosensitive channel
MAFDIVGVFQTYFYKIAEGIVILLVGFILGILTKKILFRIFKEIELNKVMAKLGITYDLEKWASSIISYVVYFSTIVTFLNHFLIGSYILYIIVGAILMLFMLTFLVGLKDLIPNLIGWIIIQRRGKVKEGYRIEVKEISGIVERVGFLETEIKTEKGDLLYVPNSLFLKSKFSTGKFT